MINDNEVVRDWTGQWQGTRVVNNNNFDKHIYIYIYIYCYCVLLEEEVIESNNNKKNNNNNDRVSGSKRTLNCVK